MQVKQDSREIKQLVIQRK